MRSALEDFFERLDFRKVAIIFSLLGFLLYANTFFNQLFWDDFDSIVNNQYVKSWKYLPKYFSENLTAGAGIKDNYWRPLLLISFSLDYKLGGVSPFFYHLQNLLWHLLSVLMVFVVIRKIFQIFYFDESGGFSNLIGFLVGIIFLIHPLQTEAVTYVAGRADPMHSALMLLSLYYFLKFFERIVIEGIETINLKDVDYLYSLIFLVLAFLTKERTVIFLGVVTLILVVFYFESLKKNWRKIFVLIAPFLAITVSYLVLRQTVLHFTDTFDLGAKDNLGINGTWEKFLILAKGMGVYFGLFFWPIKLYMEKTLVVPKSFFEIQVLVGIGLTIFLIFMAVKSIKKDPLISIGIFWFLGALSPSLHIYPIQGLLYEHWLYFPMIGFWLAFLLLAINCLERIKTKFPSKEQFLNKIVLIFVVVNCLFLGARTFARNTDWRNPIRFYEKNIKLGGYSARVYTNLGMAYSEERKANQAIENYQKAIELDGRIFQPWYNLGNTYRDLGESEKAIDAYSKAIEREPLFGSAYNNLAVIYLNEKNFSKAEEIIKKGISFNPQNIQLQVNLLLIYVQTGKREEIEKQKKIIQDLGIDNQEILRQVDALH